MVRKTLSPPPLGCLIFRHSCFYRFQHNYLYIHHYILHSILWNSFLYRCYRWLIMMPLQNLPLFSQIPCIYPPLILFIRKHSATNIYSCTNKFINSCELSYNFLYVPEVVNLPSFIKNILVLFFIASIL